jgi:hypothetical protein
MKHILPGLFLAVALCGGAGRLGAQTPTDHLMMGRGQLCNLLQYNRSTFDQYWEGTQKRGNLNLGTFTGQNVMYMGALGITDRLNVMAALPYVWTDSDSYLQGQRGIQDLSLWLKYQPVGVDAGPGHFNVFVTGGASTPVTDYVPDFLPFSIGLQSRTLSARAVVNYTADFGLYLTAQAGHTWRSNIAIDRDAYLAHGQLYYTDEVEVPNMYDATARLGFINSWLQTEFFYDHFDGLSGDDIRYNDMPFPTNRMQAGSLGWMGKYTYGALAIQLGASKVLSGRNVGESTTYSAGLLYVFRVFGKTADAAN